MKVGFIGIGKLGLACAEVMGEYYYVEGYDINPPKSATIKVVNSIEEVVKDKDLIFIAVPTPHSQEYGGEIPCTHLSNEDFDYSIVESVLDKINPHLNVDQLVVLISTVLPGTTRRHFVHRITNGRFIYNPYLIAMGSVKWDMVNPEMVIIGTEDGSTTNDAEILINFYKPLMKNNPRYVVGTWDEAESIKIFYNTFISTKISLVNMIQDVSERNGNINVDIVTDALAKSTHRIMSPAYMKAGMGDAGSCHPRDNIALRYLSQRLGLEYDIFGTIMFAREIQAKNLAQRLSQLSRDNGDLDIWIHGKAYKPGVAYLEGSYSLLVGWFLENEFGHIPHYVDPLTGDIWDSIYGVILMAHHSPTTYGNTNLEEAKEQTFYCKIEPGSIILDPWRYLKSVPGCQIIHYGNTRQHHEYEF